MTENMTDTEFLNLQVAPIREPYPPKARRVRVGTITELSPQMRRITFTGDDLEPTVPTIRLSPATHIKLVVPVATPSGSVLPTIVDGAIQRSEGQDVAMRDYTIRKFDATTRELTLDFVLHAHGAAGLWATNATPGDEVVVLGPRGSKVYPAGYARYVLGADETAMPAAERWIEEAPKGARLDLFVLVEDESWVRDLPTHPGLTLHWLYRAHGADLAKEMILAIPTDDGDTFVWASGEASSLQPLRRHLRSDAGFANDQISIHGYWKLGEAGHRDAH